MQHCILKRKNVIINTLKNSFKVIYVYLRLFDNKTCIKQGFRNLFVLNNYRTMNKLALNAKQKISRHLISCNLHLYL